MAKQPVPLTCCMITQQLDSSYFNNWNEQELIALQRAEWGVPKELAEVLYKRLDDRFGVEELHLIIHDEDTQEVWDEYNGKYIEKNKAVHFHAVVKFEKTGRRSDLPYLDEIAYELGIEPQYVEKAQKGRYAYDNMISYLIHIKYVDKHQYEPEQVYSIINLDGKKYMDYYRENHSSWHRGKAKLKARKAIEDMDVLADLILSGKVTRSEVVTSDKYYNVYANNKRKCNDLFEAYAERRSELTLQALNRGEFKLSVMFITGASGSGKTRLAKKFIDRLKEESKKNGDDEWRVSVTASTNPMDQYMGEEILLMDDVRGTAMSASDWLLLLDPYNSSPASARYKNKQPACRVIIITSTVEPLEFFYYCKKMGGGDRSEAMDQFIRRLQMCVEVFRAEDYGITNDAVATIGEIQEYDTEFQTKIGSNGDVVSMRYGIEKNGEKYTAEEAVEAMCESIKDNNNMFIEEGKDERDKH